MVVYNRGQQTTACGADSALVFVFVKCYCKVLFIPIVYVLPVAASELQWQR